MIDIEPVKEQKAKDLRAIADALIDLRPIETKTFKLNTRVLDPESSHPEVVNAVSTWAKRSKSSFIYYFALSHRADIKKIHEKVAAAKKSKVGQRDYPRIHSPSRYLYVGSSKDIAKRIKEHLGFGYKSTYARILRFGVTN